MIYFTSDTHFGHANIIKYCNRPFASVAEMDDHMIKAWNSRVKPGDTVYHLGDFGFDKPERLKEILQELNGQKWLIWGNHDKTLQQHKSLQEHFIKCVNLHEISITDKDASRESQKIVMCHYAMLVWNKSHHGAWMLHGHSHGSLKYPYQMKIMDVGVDTNDFAPISYDEVKVALQSVRTEVIDHHD